MLSSIARLRFTSRISVCVNVFLLVEAFAAIGVQCLNWLSHSRGQAQADSNAQCRREMHQAESRTEDIVALRQYTYAGRPFGDDSFVADIETVFHRKWRCKATHSLAEIAVG